MTALVALFVEQGEGLRGTGAGGVMQLGELGGGEESRLGRFL